MILSTYFQYVKIGGTDSLDAYLTRSYDGRRPGFSPAHFNFLELVCYYRQLFPPEKVLVLPYEMIRDNVPLFLMKLGDFVSTDLSDWSRKAGAYYNQRGDGRIEQRLPKLNLFLRKSSVNGYSPLYIPGAKSLIGFANRLFPISNDAYVEKLRRTIDSIVQDRYEVPNRALSKLSGIDLSQYGYHN